MSELETPEGLKKHYDSLIKYNPDQPRDEKGRWTAGAEDNGTVMGPKGRDTKATQPKAGERAALVRDSKIEKEFPKAWKVHVLSINGDQAKVQIWEGGVGYTRSVPLKDLKKPE